MTNFKRSLFWLVMLCITAIACNDPSNIGSELVAGEFSDIRFTDTLTVQTLSSEQDSVFTYTNNTASQPSSYLVGNIDEPTFGSAKAATYISFVLNQTSQAGGADFEGATFDSLVLSLAYDSLRTYGDTLNPQDFEVHQVVEPMVNTTEYYYSDRGFAIDPTPIGELSGFYPKPTTRVTNITNGDTITYSPNLRIHMNETLGQAFMDEMQYDSAAYSTSESFQTLFSGIKVSSASPNANILGFNLKSSLSYMRLYYTKDTIQSTYTFIIADQSVKYSEYEHDYSGSVAEPFIENQAMSDSLSFLQGMSGTNIKIDFPTIGSLEDIIVNKAELEFTGAYIPGDDTISYSGPLRLAVTYLDDDGNYFFIDDMNLAIALGNLNTFGGVPEWDDVNGVFVQKYRMNISNYLQDIIDCTDGDGAISNCLPNNAINNSLYLQVYLKNQYANRGIFYGGSHSEYPVKLHLTYTQQ